MSTIAQQGQQVVHEHVLKSFEQVVADEERYIGRKLSPEELDAVKERLNYFKVMSLCWVRQVGLLGLPSRPSSRDCLSI